MMFRQRVWLLAWALWMCAPLGAGTIDVSAATSVTLETGDALSFAVPLWNYALDAALYGAPAHPTQMAFSLMTAPPGPADSFTADLLPGDGSADLPFPAPLEFAPGWFAGSRYQGAVAVLSGSVALDSVTSQQIFSAGPALLVLRNSGTTATLGLPPYTLQQDFTANLFGPPLDVGAAPSGVSLSSAASQAPEPNPGILLLGGGALLCAISEILRRACATKTRSTPSKRGEIRE